MPASRTAASNGKQLLVAQLARPDVGRRLVQAALGQAVADDVLAGREHAVDEVGALEPADVGAAELGGEVRVLAVGLLDAAPARVAGDVEDRRERLPGAGRQHPPADRRRRSPRRASGSNAAAAPIDCWKQGASRASRPWSVSSWRIAGMPEPRLLDEEALDLVAGGSATSTGVAGSSRRRPG